MSTTPNKTSLCPKMVRGMDPRRRQYMEQFNLPVIQVRRRLSKKIMDMLDSCKDDEARKVLLGIREPMLALTQKSRPGKLA